MIHKFSTEAFIKTNSKQPTFSPRDGNVTWKKLYIDIVYISST